MAGTDDKGRQSHLGAAVALLTIVGMAFGAFFVLESRHASASSVELLNAKLDSFLAPDPSEAEGTASVASAVSELSNRVKALENNRASSIQTTIQNMNVSVVVTGDTPQAINGRKIGEAQASCPEGQVLVGLTVIDRDGGGYCSTCIQGVEMRCARLELR